MDLWGADYRLNYLWFNALYRSVILHVLFGILAIREARLTTVVKGDGTYLSSQQVDDLKGVLDNTHSHQLLAIVAAVHHHGVGQTFHNGTLCLAKTFCSITSSRVWQVLSILLFYSNVILQCK